MRYISTKIIPMGSTAFRQWRADSHCKLIHGYRLQCKLWFTADELDERNWVFDFGGCKEIKKILEKQYDHTTVVAADDPELDTFKLMSDKGMIDLRIAEKGVGIERTAEWVYDTVNEYVLRSTQNRVRVIKVEVWEHEGNSAVYEEVNDRRRIYNVESDSIIANNIDNFKSIDNGIESSKVETNNAEILNKSVNTGTLKTKPEIKPMKPANPTLHAKRSSGYGNLFAGTSWGD